MARCADPERLRPLLDSDRPWALYLLGDLEPHLRAHSEWWHNERAVVLLYRRFAPPVLVAFGDADAVRPLLAELPDEPLLHLHVRPEILALLRERYDVPEAKPMMRMRLEAEAQRTGVVEGLARLSPGDVPALSRLYDDGRETGESPDFFAPEMVADGVYFGVREGRELIGAAGTHLLAPAAGAAAIGNVYTRRDRRGRGLAAATTSAVIADLGISSFRTIGLSVRQSNQTAIRVYRRLGFREHCPFFEGVARLRAAPPRATGN